MTESTFDKLYIEVSKVGLGQKRARGSGIGLQKLETGEIEISIGRKSGNHWNNVVKATAWAHLSAAEAHEMAHAIMFLTGDQIPCIGTGVQTDGVKHKVNLKVDVAFTVDLCTMLSQPTTVREEILGRLKKKLDAIKLPTEETLV